MRISRVVVGRIGLMPWRSSCTPPATAAMAAMAGARGRGTVCIAGGGVAQSAFVGLSPGHDDTLGAVGKPRDWQVLKLEQSRVVVGEQLLELRCRCVLANEKQLSICCPRRPVGDQHRGRRREGLEGRHGRPVVDDLHLGARHVSHKVCDRRQD
eukprot:2204217-Prymnesium_polylepis.1